MGKMNNDGSGAVAAEKWFRALGDGHRLRILDLLAETEMNAGELLEQVDVVQSTLSHHMKTLCESGLVRARKRGKWTLYTVDREAVSSAREYLTRYMEAVQAQVQDGEETVPAEKKQTERKQTERKPRAAAAKKAPEELEEFADTSADTISYDTVVRKSQDAGEDLKPDKKAKGKEKAKDKGKDKSKKAKEKDKDGSKDKSRSGKGKDKKKKKDNRF